MPDDVPNDGFPKLGVWLVPRTEGLPKPGVAEGFPNGDAAPRGDEVPKADFPKAGWDAG